MVTKNLEAIDTVMEPSLKTMHYLLSKTMIKQLQLPKFTGELLIFFGTLIYRDDKPKQMSEEVKQLVVSCISLTLPAAYKEGRYKSFMLSPNYQLVGFIRDDSFLPKASQGIKGLVDIIQYEKNIQLRLDASDVLNQYLIDNINDTDMIATMFPGIASKLCVTLTQRPEKENHKVVSKILRTLAELIQIFLGDESNDTLTEIRTFQDIVKVHSSSTEQDTTKDSKKIRSASWYEKTKTSLLPMLNLALKNRSYTDWRKRMAYLDFSYALLSTCTHTLDNCVRLLVNVIVLHRDDPYNEISNKSVTYMEVLRHHKSFDNIILPILKNELYECIMKFPKHMISGDEQNKTNVMALISGLVLLLGCDSMNVLSTALSKSSDGWMTALEIDKDNLHTLEERMSQKFIEQAGEDNQVPLYPKIRFKYIVNDDTSGKLSRMLNIIGKYCDLQIWIYHYMRYVSVDSLNQSEPQAIYIVHSLLAGAIAIEGSLEQDEIMLDWIEFYDEDSEGSGFLKNISRQVLNDTINMLTFAASVSTESTSYVTKTTPSPIVTDDNNIYALNVCFALQLVGLAASVMATEDLQELLITMLYPLLAHLGSSNIYIHAYALITLNTIASTCGLKSVRDLAITNIDYVINMISQHISIISVHNRVPFVLKALINVSGSDSIKYLEDTVQEICDTLDRYHHNNQLSLELCSVLAEIVYIVERDLAHHENTAETTKEESGMNFEESISEEISIFIRHEEDLHEKLNVGHKSMEDIGKYFLDRQEKGLNEDLTLEQAIREGSPSFSKSGEEESEDEQEATNKKEEEEKPLTYEQTMVKHIMEKASNFLTASSPQLRSQILQLLGSGVSVLSSQVSTLNILVHDSWVFIVNRFSDKENYVVYQAARLIETISAVSTDFLSKKFVQDVWPRFKTLLRKGVDISLSNSESNSYSTYSNYHRTQLCVLNSLKNILKYVPITQPLTKEVLEETKFYYSYDKIHPQLRETCFEIFESLCIQQPDTVWLYQLVLNIEFQDKLKTPTSSLLEPFVIPEWIKPGAYIIEQNKSPVLL
ncbi:hypothetical protein G6F56_001743 [Rhizopus delemar]|nr:hypothetical protein G6F56_001743 [Rhizopus delemar]